MDKKNFTIGVLLLLAAFGALYFSPRRTPPPPAATPSAASPSAAPAAAPVEAGSPAVLQAAPSSGLAAVTEDDAAATITTLSNDFIEARFTSAGGAVRDVAFKKYPAQLGSSAPFVFNALHADPMLAIVSDPALGRSVRYERVSQTANEVVYRAVVDGRIEVTRRYTIAPSAGENTDPYQLRHETTFRNLTGQAISFAQPVTLALGTAAPNSVDDQHAGMQLTTGVSTDGKQEFIRRSDLEASGGFFGIGAHAEKVSVVTPGPLVWVAVKNQFFTSILTPDQPIASVVTQRVKLSASLPNETPNAYGITGTASFDLKSLEPDGEAKLGANFYVGPKEYSRLANSNIFKHDQAKVMQFGFFKYFSQILLTLMTWIHGFVGNWGVAIVLTTLTLKTIFIPFTLAASRSAKRMAKLQPELQVLREKFKDNPQKQQAATMELFKKHKVNPVGGCLPILITIPFFMGFFQMLQSTAELRFAPFLWARDLASEDTVALIFGYPLNILPLLMGATMIIQMQLTPSPTVDNAQAKMMKFMPVIFTLFCYRFSCALSLYSFTNGLFTIGQQLVINRMKDPAETASPSVAAATTASTLGRAMKNVTPKKGDKH
jgi:YidC/Oxa1 family membrane protein insertase